MERSEKQNVNVEVWYALLLPDGNVELVEKVDEFPRRSEAVRFIAKRQSIMRREESLEMVHDGRLLAFA